MIETLPEFAKYVKLSFEAPRDETLAPPAAPAPLRGTFNFRALRAMELYSI